MKQIIKSIIFITLLVSTVAHANQSTDPKQDWYPVAFGQSTDLNFSSLVKPEKIGMNNVWLTGSQTPMSAGQATTLPSDFIIESRGGKIANSHDGMTVLYKKLPINQTFILEADVILEQLGPEVDGKTPAAQEAVGLFVRDIIGPQRQDPQPAGYEEFPNAANMLMNALITQNKKNDNLVQITALVRDGVTQAWGNEGIITTKTGYQKEITYTEQRIMHLVIKRTAQAFILSWSDPKTGEQATWQMDDLNGFMNQQQQDNLYVGFFASRNAKARFINATLTLTDDQTNYNKLAKNHSNSTTIKPVLTIASPTTAYNQNYTLQIQTTHAGKLSIKQNNQAQQFTVTAGEVVQFATQLNSASNNFEVAFTSDDKQTVNQTMTVNLAKSNLTDLSQIYVAVDGKANAKGTIDSPVDLLTAIQSVAPNGSIYLADGHYTGITIPAEYSGLPEQLKTLIAQNRHQAIFIDNTFNLDSHYWQLHGIVFDGNINNKDNQPAFLRISGSHNIVEQVITRNNNDTGLAITAKDKNIRSLWPAYNLIVNSDSYNNQDKSGINADGFAAKLGVGPGNIFRGCIAHHNTDDGWDLFNKIENGPNEPVLIENSIAYANGLPFNKPNILKGSIGNGFKLGGEGQPVNHKVIGSIAFNNNMDGFTDNFNTGSIVIENNVAINNARYNYIIRSNPYPFLQPTIIFNNNWSIRTTWNGQIVDSFGEQVISSGFQSLTLADYQTQLHTKQDLPDTIERDDTGKIIYPAILFKNN